MKVGKKFLAIIIVAVVVILGGLTVLSQSVAKKEVIPPITTVKSIKGDIEEKLDTTGTVESQNKKTFFSPINGTVKVLGMETGDSVKSGTKLVTFDLEDLEKENQKAEWNIQTGKLDMQDTLDTANTAASKQAAAAANVGPLQAAVDAQEQYIKDLQDAINDANKDAQQDAIDAAAKSIKDQKAALKKAYDAQVKAYNKEVTTYNKNLNAALTKYNTAIEAYNISDSAYNQAFELWNSDKTNSNKTALDKATEKRSKDEITLRDTKAEYENFLNNPPAAPAAPDYSTLVASTDTSTAVADTTELQQELENATSDLAELKTDLSQEKATAEADVTGVSSATLEKMNISNNLSELEAKSIDELIAEGKQGLLAEFNGVISNCTVTEGSTVTQGMELFTIQSTEDVSVEITISKNDYEKVTEGQKATITMGANTYHGTVSKVNKIATPNEKGTPVILAKVQIDDPDENIFIGVDAKVTVEVAKAKDVIMVPVSAVNIGNSGSFCYVIENDTIVKKDVETGISSVDYVEIKSGLTEGADILTDIGTFMEGDKATAVPESSEQTSETAVGATEDSIVAEETETGSEGQE